MGKRELAESAEKPKYFASVHPATSEVENESKEKQGTEHGTREIGILYPFIISGGKNTERFYFKHINDLTDYKFNIKPEYFADESNYTEVFPKRIREILSKNTEAKIYCVFDWDTIYADETCLKKHDVFVLPTFNECFPLVLLEAMEQGLPCVSSAIGGTPEIVDEGETGFLVPCREVEPLAERIGWLLEDEALRKRLGTAGRAKFEREYTLPRFEEKIKQCLEACL